MLSLDWPSEYQPGVKPTSSWSAASGLLLGFSHFPHSCPTVSLAALNLFNFVKELALDFVQRLLLRLETATPFLETTEVNRLSLFNILVVGNFQLVNGGLVLSREFPVYGLGILCLPLTIFGYLVMFLCTEKRMSDLIQRNSTREK